jgi:homopolymeric O-antigen transport system ATP-binding protein
VRAFSAAPKWFFSIMPDKLVHSDVDLDARDTRPAIRLTGVRKEYRLYSSFTEQALDVLGVAQLRFWRPVKFRTFTALDGIDLEIRHGERVGIVGRNGAGKTTMLKLITGNFAPTAGTIAVDGQVQALMQTGLGFHGEFTGMENIRSSLVYNGLAGDELEEAVSDIIDFCELGDFIDQPVKTYSLGMRARLQFAAATAIKPDIVVIDEVLGAGDAYFAGKSNERIRRMTGNGATLLIVSHSMEQILQFSDRAVWVDSGRIIASGDPLEIVNRYEEFIHKVDRAHREGAATSGMQFSPAMTDIPAWVREKNEEGNGGADWGGEGPLHMTRIGVLNEHRAETDTIVTGKPFGIFAEIVSDKEGRFPCSCLFVIYNEQGDVVARVVEPERDYVLNGKMQRVEVRFDYNPIGTGNYLLSGGLYRDYKFGAADRARRYHILSRACQMRVFSDVRDNSRIRLRPRWTIAINKQPGHLRTEPTSRV